MSFLNKVKNYFNKDKTEATKSKKQHQLFSYKTPTDVDNFFKTAKKTSTLSISERKQKEYILEILNKLDKNLVKDIGNSIRKELYATEYIDELDSDINNSLISLRFSLLNPVYKKNKDKRLAKLFMIFFSIAPDLMQGKKTTGKNDLFSFSVDEDVDEIMSDLSFFNLSAAEIKETTTKILEFNKKNVSYTNEEMIFLNNSETLRHILEKLSTILQDFIQQASVWEQYLIPENIGLEKYKVNILNIDKKLIFKDKFYSSFFDLVMEKNINVELKPLVSDDLKELFEKDLSFVIGSVRNKILSEHEKLIYNFEKVLAWSIILLKGLDELPPHNVLNSLIAKSLKFHDNYYPNLVQAVNPVREKLLAMIKKDYKGMRSFLFCYEKHIAEGVSYYSHSKFSKTNSYAEFIEQISVADKTHTFNNEEHNVVEYYPEELNLLKRSPDAELSIIMLNEKVGIAEKGLPIVDGDYFYAYKLDFLKVVLFDTLLTMMNDDVSLKIVRSLLLKSLDRHKGESSELMETLLLRLREEGFKRELIVKLQKKQLKKNHVTSRIKQKIAENKTWEWLVASEDPIVVVDKFSKVTGLTFFSLSGSRGKFTVTATFKGDDWYINRIAPEQKK